MGCNHSTIHHRAAGRAQALADFARQFGKFGADTMATAAPAAGADVTDDIGASPTGRQRGFAHMFALVAHVPLLAPGAHDQDDVVEDVMLQS